jgi:putative colanic acid biosynthesis acetyltransferase WcaF
MSRPSPLLDAAKHSPLNGGASFTLSNRLTRLAWLLVWGLAASWTPSQFQPWRHFLLRLFGAKMGYKSDVRGSARVWLPAFLEMADHAVIGPGVNCYNQAPISLGKRALVSQGAHLCAGSHNIDDEHFSLVATPISIGAYAWVAAEAFIGPGTAIGEGTVVGARTVAFGQLDPWMVYTGNPAMPRRARQWRPTNG